LSSTITVLLQKRDFTDLATLQLLHPPNGLSGVREQVAAELSIPGDANAPFTHAPVDPTRINPDQPRHRRDRVTPRQHPATQAPEAQLNAVAATQFQHDLRRERGAATREVPLLIQALRNSDIAEPLGRQLLDPGHDLGFELAAPSRRDRQAHVTLA